MFFGDGVNILQFYCTIAPPASLGTCLWLRSNCFLKSFPNWAFWIAIASHVRTLWRENDDGTGDLKSNPLHFRLEAMVWNSSFDDKSLPGLVQDLVSTRIGATQQKVEFFFRNVVALQTTYLCFMALRTCKVQDNLLMDTSCWCHPKKAASLVTTLWIIEACATMCEQANITRGRDPSFDKKLLLFPNPKVAYT
jgi:hypothetical protein